MKKFIKRFILFIISSIIFCFSAFPVSAAVTKFPIPDKVITHGNIITNDIVNNFITSINKNDKALQSGLNLPNSFSFLYSDRDTLIAYVFDSDGIYKNASKWGNNYLCYYSNTYLFCTFDSSGNLSYVDVRYNNDEFISCVCFVDSQNRYTLGSFNDYGSVTSSSFDNFGDGYSNYTVFPLVPPFNPIVAPIYEAVYSLSIEKEEFIKWLIDNEKYVEIADSLVKNRVSGFVDIFQRYGANSKAFAYNVKQFFEFIGISQTVSDYDSVLEKTRSLYREYQKSVRQQLINHYNNKVKDTLNIKPLTNDNNTSLITDSSDDSVVVRLLRDILRSLISLPVNIGDLIRSLEVKLDNLDNSVIIANDGGSSDLSVLWTYSSNDFDDDLLNFTSDVAEVQRLPLQCLTNINENPLMPEKMLSDKDNLTVNIPNMSGFTVSDNGKSFSTQTTSYTLSSNNYPWLDSLAKKIKRFSGILLIIGYLVSLRYRLPEIVRGE